MDFPFRSSGPVDEPAGADGAAPGNRRPVTLAFLAAVVLAAGGFLVLTGDSEPTDVALTTLPAAPAVTAVTPVPAVTASPSAGAAASELRAGRDPFQALRTEVAAAAPAAAAGAPDTPDMPPPVAAPAEPTSVVVPPPGTSSPTAPARALRTLSLLAVEGEGAGRTAVFTVDGTRVRAGVGDSFGPAGQLLLLSLQQEPDGGGWTAVVQATGGEPFDVVTGRPASLP